MLAFASTGMLVGILVYKQLIPTKEFNFLNDPRNSFFAILGLMVLMVSAILLTYVYVEKFTSVIYFSRSLNSGSLANSEKMLANAIILDKSDVYYRSLSQVYLSQISKMANDKSISADTLKTNLQQLINVAQSNAELAVRQNPNQYLNYVNLGNVYGALVPLSVTNSYESAVAAYDRAAELAPSNPSIPLYRAQLEFVKGDNDKSKEYIDKALLLKPDYTDARFLLVQIETNSGDLPTAIKQAEYAGQLSPNDETIFFRLGLLRYNNSDYTGAVSAFEKAITLNPNYLDARYFLGQAYQKVGRNDDALQQYQILTKAVPDSEEVKKAIDSINNATPTITPTTTSPTDKKSTSTSKSTKTP
jgi:tetratricopeptide (TPR) repeat protein